MPQHYAGEIGYTSTRKPVELVWQGEFETREGAIAFEQQIKGWSRAKKEALIRGDWDEIKQLARSASTVRVELVEAVPNAHGGRVNETSPSTGSGRTDGLLQGVLDGNAAAQRRAIAKAITLLESTRTDHRAQGDELLTALLPHTGKAFRLGISGVPGVGKSTFIEVLGLYLITQGHRVAVLTIDPSSSVSGGSILGDKTRMEQLSVHDNAYIRPSPSSGTLGGVAEKTREAMLVCEAAGYDIVIVETVGVGQSETAVANMTDMFVLMQLPNAGDDLQAIKKGVMELADLVIINKADIDADAAMRAQAQITSAMRLFGLVNNAMGQAQAAAYDSFWHPQVIQLSALHNTGVDAFWTAVTQFKTIQTTNGRLAARRQQQSLSWMWERIDAALKQAFRQDPAVSALLPAMLADVAGDRIPASTAARNLLSAHAGRA
jgi:LAO/AO transport system kinase